MTLPESKNVLPLEGEIDLHVSPRVSQKLAEIIRSKPSRVVVDLSRVTYIDSSGLATLIQGMRDVEDYGGRFALAPAFLLISAPAYALLTTGASGDPLLDRGAEELGLVVADEVLE